MNRHLNKPPPRPSAVRRDLSPALAAVLATAMAKRAVDRYGACREFTAAARAALSPAAAPHFIPPPRPTTQPPVRPPRVPVTAQIPGAAPRSWPLPRQLHAAGAPPSPSERQPTTGPPRPGGRSSTGVRPAPAAAVQLASALAAFAVPGHVRQMQGRSALPLPAAAPLEDGQLVAALVIDGNLALYVSTRGPARRDNG